MTKKNKSKWFTLQGMAIRSVWAIARRCGLDDGTLESRMSRDDVMRQALVRAWLAGYKRGREHVLGENARKAASNAIRTSTLPALPIERDALKAENERLRRSLENLVKSFERQDGIEGGAMFFEEDVSAARAALKGGAA